MNTKKKGDKAENEVYKIFKAWGYIVNPAPRTMRPIYAKDSKTPRFFVSQRNDHWGIFDGEARNTVHNFHFQVKSNVTDVSKCKPKIEKFSKQYLKDFEIAQIWLRVQRKGYVVFEYNDVQWDKEYYNFRGELVDKFKYS